MSGLQPLQAYDAYTTSIQDSQMLSEESIAIPAAKAQSALLKLEPLTLPHKDRAGRIIKLWEVARYGLVGAVLHREGNLTIVPGTKIYNPLNRNETADNIILHLKTYPLKNWDIVFDARHSTLTIWPHLKAAGKYDKSDFDDSLQDMKQRLNTLTRGGALNHRHYEAYRNESKGIPLLSEHGTPILKKDGRPFNHIKDVHDHQRGAARLINDIKQKLATNDLASEQRAQIEKLLSQISKTLDDSRKFTTTQRRYDAIAFQENVQRHNLTKSYNSCHPKTPMPAKANQSGQIGGVAASAGHIDGLFEGIQGLFEYEHFFAVPTVDGKPPFSYAQMQQLIRELAIGIYLHDTVPFFSLHFNAQGNLVPVLHPAYDNTLVGRVISLLDYFMKGFLNGGVFEEAFILNWQNTRTKDSATLLEHIVDFQKYVQQQLGDDVKYLSVRQLLIRLQILSENGSARDIPDFHEDCQHLQSSFRIISKQHSIQKSESLFLIDSDFDVFYTLEPDATYLEKVRHCRAQTGKEPESMQRLRQAYDTMAESIKETMPKLPICRELFAMLGVIGFFTHYFTTLKANGKVPQLDPISINPTAVAPLYPSLPLRTMTQAIFSFDVPNLFTQLTNDSKKVLIDWMKDPTEKPIDDRLVQEMTAGLIKQAATQVAPGILRAWQSPEKNKNLVPRVIDLIKEFHRYTHDENNRSFFTKFVNCKEEEYPNLFSKFSFLPWKINQEILELPSEINIWQEGVTKRIVGGCGLTFAKIPVSASVQASELLSHNALSIATIKDGEWLPLHGPTKPQVDAYAFALSFDDFTAGGNEDYQFLTHSLNPLPHYDFWQAAAKCIFSGEYEELRKMEASDEAWKSCNASGQTVLHIAASYNKPQLCKFLIEKGLLVTATDHTQQTAVHAACAAGAIECLQILLDVLKTLCQQADKHGQTPLHIIARHGHNHCLQILFDNGALVNARANHDFTPLLTALHHQQWDIAEMLILRNGVDVNAATQDGQTAMFEAIENRQEKLVKVLIDKGAHLWALRKDGISASLLAAKLGAPQIFTMLLNADDYSGIQRTLPSGETMLHVAVQSGNQEISELILTRRPQLLTHLSGANRSCLLEALMRGCEPLAMLILSAIDTYLHPANPVVKTLCDGIQAFISKIVIQVRRTCNGVHVPNHQALIQILNQCDDENLTPFVAACRFRSFDAATYLLKLGASLPALDELISSLAYAPAEFITEIERRQPLTNAQRETLLVVAAQRGNISLVMKLMPTNMPADPNVALQVLEGCVTNNIAYSARRVIAAHPSLVQSCLNGRGILALAAAKGCRDVLKWALQQYKTAAALLHAFEEACKAGHIACIEILYPHLTKPNISLNEQGMNAAHIAAANNQKQVLQYLLRHGFRSYDQDVQGNDVLDHALMNKADEVITSLHEQNHQIHAKSLSIAKSAKSLANLLKREQFTQEDVSRALIDVIKTKDHVSMRLLLENGAVTDKIIDGEWTALMYAAAQGDHQALSLFLERSINVNHFAKGMNALHHAVAGRHLRCIKLLLSYGFQAEQQDSNGRSSFDIAKDHPWLIRMLKDTVGFSQKVFEVQSVLGELEPEKLLEAAIDLPLDQPLFICPDGMLRPLLLAALFCGKYQTGDNLTRLINAYPRATEVVDEDRRGAAHILARLNIAPQDGFSVTCVDSKGTTALHIYAVSASKELLTKVIQGVDTLDLADDDGQTPLHFAVLAAKEGNVQVLLHAKANPNAQTKDGHTALRIAAASGDKYIVKMLLRACARIDISRQLALHTALDNGHEDIAFLLVQQGANLLERDQTGSMPAHYAAQRGCTAFLRYLKAQSEPLQVPNYQDIQPPHLAAIKGQVEALAIVGEDEVYKDPNAEKRMPSLQEYAAQSGNYSALQALWKQAASDPDHKLSDNLLAYAIKSGIHQNLEKLLQTPLQNELSAIQTAAFAAAMKDDVVALKLIQEKTGIRFSLLRINGRNPLHWACAHGSTRAALFLLEAGVNGTYPDEKGKTPLQIAACKDNPILLRELLSLLPLPEDEDGRSLLHHAAAKGALRNVAVLVNAGFDVKACDLVGVTALHVACRAGHTSCVELLLLAGADPFATSLIGKKPEDIIPREAHLTKERWAELISAIQNHPPDVNRLHLAILLRKRQYWPLLVRIYNVNERDREGKTALHHAVQMREHKLIRLLLDQQPEINVSDHKGLTALWIAAVVAKDIQGVQMLLAAGADRTCIGPGNLPLVEALANQTPSEPSEILTLIKQGGTK